jgi:chromosome segregation ATPase
VRSKQTIFLYLPLALLLASAAGVLRAGEPEPAAYMPVYLISEAELRSIEEYKRNSEAEKQAWRLQVQELKTQALGLQRESKTLNNQLTDQQEQSRILRRSFNEYEAEVLTTISIKNGEIADLKQTAADLGMETEKYKGISRRRLFAIIALAGTWIGFFALKICRFFRLF